MLMCGMINGYRRVLCHLSLSGLLLLAGCSTAKNAAGTPDIRLDQQTVAVMTTVDAEEAERLRLSLLRGQGLPASAQLFSIDELIRINPALGKIATQLADCEISRPIPPPASPTDRQTSNGYLVLQRGGDPDQPCHGSVSRADRESWSDKAGEVLIGLLVVGMAGFLAAVPFLFHIF